MSRVEVIFDTIIATPWQLFSDVRPFIAKLFVQVENLFLLILIYWCLIDVGVEVVVPSEKRSGYGVRRHTGSLTSHGTACQYECEF